MRDFGRIVSGNPVCSTTLELCFKLGNCEEWLEEFCGLVGNESCFSRVE